MQLMNEQTTTATDAPPWDIGPAGPVWVPSPIRAPEPPKDSRDAAPGAPTKRGSLARIAAGPVLTYESGVNTRTGFSALMTIRTAQIDGQRWLVANDVTRAVALPKPAPQYLGSLPGDMKRVIYREECPQLFTTSGGATSLTLISVEALRPLLERRTTTGRSVERFLRWADAQFQEMAR